MDAEREMDAYCEGCKSVRPHRLLGPGSCACKVCGREQQLMSPLAD